jgi:hypothetical protein
MNRSFLALDRNHLGDISLLVGFIYSLLICFYATGVCATSFIRSNGFSLGAMWTAWDATFSGIKEGILWTGPVVLAIGTVFGIIGLFEKKQNKTKSISGLLLCILWCALCTLLKFMIESSRLNIISQ